MTLAITAFWFGDVRDCFFRPFATSDATTHWPSSAFHTTR